MDEEKLAYLQEFYTLEQLSTELNITVRTLREEIKDGKLKASKTGNRYVIQREDIKKWLDNTRVN